MFGINNIKYLKKFLKIKVLAQEHGIKHKVFTFTPLILVDIKVSIGFCRILEIDRQFLLKYLEKKL